MRKIAFVAGALFAGVVGIASSNGQEADPSLYDQQAFAESVAKIYEHTAPGVNASVVAPLELDVHTPRGDFKAYLDAAYAFCHRDLVQCDAFVHNQVKAMTTRFLVSSAPPDLSELRVTVRPSGYVDQITSANSGKSAPIAEPLVGDLWVIGVRDEPTTIATLSQAELDELKLDAKGAMAAGKRNVEATLGAKFLAGAPQIQPGEGVSGLRGDDYIASLLALPDLWTPLAERFDGELYVAAPASDYILFADARATGNAAKIAHDAAVIARAAKRPLSTDVFEWTPTGWEVVDLANAK
jgi:hypothetical protein